MKNCSVLVIFSLVFSFTIQAQKCSQPIENSLGIKASFCPDGSITFEQPSSKPLKLNLLKFRSELMSMMTVPQLESFPDQYREPLMPKSQTLTKKMTNKLMKHLADQ